MKPRPVLTFEQFVATRRFHKNIKFADRGQGEKLVPGFVYECGLYIEQWLSSFYLCIETVEYESDTLEPLERKLYEYGLVGGYFVSPHRTVKEHVRDMLDRLPVRTTQS